MSTAVLDRPSAPVVPPTPEPEDAARPLLSEALREGATHHPQSYGIVYNPATGGTCALGAIAVGLMGPAWTVHDPSFFERHSMHHLVWTKTGVDLNRLTRGPAASGPLSQRDSLAALIMRLNDVHGWGREKIADWLESIGL